MLKRSLKRILGKLVLSEHDSHEIALKDGLIEGNGVSVMSGVNFGSEPYLIQLDDYVRLSVNVLFVTHDGGTWAFRDIEKYKDVIKFGRIHIGERTFVGANSIIMPGVTIGKRCVIGAGSVVTKDVPDGMVACGTPARIVMTTEEYAEKSLASLKPYNKEKYLKDKKDYLIHYLE